jgi:predicted acylesterase/phospholipase RssA
LAFQGGGAKGLAYVGAYKVIKRESMSPDGKKIRAPIKSIMGSSAGGIIALAISTGIPDYELQKICYKMNNIPTEDRFVNDKKSGDNGREPIDKIKRLLSEYGILQK